MPARSWDCTRRPIPARGRLFRLRPRRRCGSACPRCPDRRCAGRRAPATAPLISSRRGRCIGATANTPCALVVALTRSATPSARSTHGDEVLDGTVGHRGRGRGRVDTDEDLFERRALVERGRDDPRPLAHEEPALVAGVAVAEERPQPLDVGVMVPERARHASLTHALCGSGTLRLQAAFRASRAVVTRAPKVSGSRTARSARILRSTSTSAAFRPAMNRE